MYPRKAISVRMGFCERLRPTSSAASCVGEMSEGILSRVSWRLDNGGIAANGMADKEFVNIRSENMSKCLV